MRGLTKSSSMNRNSCSRELISLAGSIASRLVSLSTNRRALWLYATTVGILKGYKNICYTKAMNTSAGPSVVLRLALSQCDSLSYYFSHFFLLSLPKVKSY